ncbi:MAG TPA: transporter substrate-binding domain-containing protein [Chthoniobacteraceae bacterium]|nr:transporter substrate-binding domain-containing protein [Chthoniobacteraceae bacterium]
MRRLIKLFLACLFLGGFSARGAEPPLKVGMELAYPPFEMRDEKGEPQGVSVDLARALAESLGRPLEIQNLPFDGLILSLKTGKIDIILSSMTLTPERARVVDFSDPYLKTGLCLLVGTKNDAKSIADLNQAGKTIAVKKGTTGQLYATTHLKSPQVLVLDKEAAAVLEVVQGKSDAFIYDQMSVYSHWKRNQQTTRALLEPFQQESWAIALPKGSPMREKVNAFLKSFRDAGGFEKLGDKWLAEQKAEFKRLGIPFFF